MVFGCFKRKKDEHKIVEDYLTFIMNKKEDSFMVQLPYMKTLEKEEFSNMYRTVNKLMIYDPKKDDYVCHEEIVPWPELIINLTNRIKKRCEKLGYNCQIAKGKDINMLYVKKKN